jgi:L-asparaginase / beta-aspartyl-peptidase
MKFMMTILCMAALGVPARAASNWQLAIHGGAGVIEPGSLTPEHEAAYRAGLKAALEAGAGILRSGGSSLDAVEATVRVLEDNPLFNAGKGAVFNAEGHNELDAAIMDGRTRAAGAIAGVTRTKNPVSLARAVMEKTPHVMLVGAGADAFSLQAGMAQVDPGYFRTEERWQQYLQWRDKKSSALPDRTHAYGTVGAVALDQAGHLAAATSTGGTVGKRWDRVGDSPIIGAGTFAEDGVCAVSATGDGEFFIRASAARQLRDRMAWHREGLQSAADSTIKDVGGLGGEGGLIAIDAKGHVAFAMNSTGMYRGSVGSATPAHTAIYATER